MMKRIILTCIVFTLLAVVSCTNNISYDDPIEVSGTIQRRYTSENAIDLLDKNQNEWKVYISFDLPIQHPSKSDIFFDQLQDADYITIKGKRFSEHEIEAEEIWSGTPPTQNSSNEFEYNLYFTNFDLAKDPNNCDEVFSQPRSIKGSIQFDDVTRFQLVLTDLLQGPSKDERSQGYTTSLPEDAICDEIRFDEENKTLILNFSSLTIAGSCNVQAARTQIEKTFTQFSSVENVRILLNGSESEALQP
ncbi:MAG TPA: GerMN domain-containing protein [Caldisericia bacterium]|nr:GerMN domain-containing protein [Caldisericia bacterium]